MTLFSRLFKLFVAVIITPLFVTGVFLFYYQNSGKKAVLENYFNLADISASYIKQNIEDNAARLNFLGDSVSLYYQDLPAFKTFLDNAVKANPEFIIVAFLGKDGKELVRAGRQDIPVVLPEIDISQDEAFSQIDSADIIISKIDGSLSAPYAEVVYPLKDGSYIFSVLDLSYIWYSVILQRLGSTGGLYLATQDGFLTFNAVPAPALKAGALKKTLTSVSGFIEKIKTEDGQIYVGAYSATVLPDIYVVTLQYSKEAFYSITLTSWLIAFFLLATTTLSYFAAYAFSKELSEPVEKLTKGAQEISSGNFAVNIKAEGAWGEFDILINAFNEMASRLAAYQAVQLDKILDEKKKTDLLARLMRDGLVMCSESGTLLFANATANKILESDALCGDLECTLYGTMPRPDLKSLLSVNSGTVFAYNAGTQKRYFEIVNELFRPANQEPLYILIFRDITAEHEIRTMKNDIFNAVAHDLRAPLMGLQAYIMILQEASLDDKKRAEILSSMESSSKMLSTLVENILDVSRLERGLLTLNKQRFDITALLNDVITALKPLAQKKQLYIKNNLPPHLEVFADRNLTERIFSNLISNSVKFTDKGGIEVLYQYLTAKEGAAYHKFTVKDSGRGISKAELPKIFDKYHQADRSEKGYGLGLSIVRQSVLAHGGTIEAQSQEGRGCEISFTLPAGGSL